MKRHLPRLLSFRSSKRKQLQSTNVFNDTSSSDMSFSNVNFSFKQSSRTLPGDIEVARNEHHSTTAEEEEFYDDEELIAEIARSEISTPISPTLSSSPSSSHKPTIIRIGDSDDEFLHHHHGHREVPSPKSISSDEGCFSMVRIFLWGIK
uniref:Uncharacterized protein n=1 Tax=Panagrolaimus sp. ES5 TaxID=591445 RepID=A0AC34GPC9_9BILA